jgi:hypothetical protein
MMIMNFASTWCTGEERSRRLELALRLIDRFERRMSLQAPWSLAAFACATLLLCTIVLIGALLPGFSSLPVFLLCLAPAALIIVAYGFCYASLGFFFKGHRHANFCHPVHHHRLPCSPNQFAERFSNIPYQEHYENALHELHLLRVQGKKKFAYLRNAFLCIGLSGVALLLIVPLLLL